MPPPTNGTLGPRWTIVPSLCGKVSTRGSRVSSIGNAVPSRRIPTIASSARFVDAQLRGIVGIELHVALSTEKRS